MDTLRRLTLKLEVANRNYLTIKDIRLLFSLQYPKAKEQFDMALEKGGECRYCEGKVDTNMIMEFNGTSQNKYIKRIKDEIETRFNKWKS